MKKNPVQGAPALARGVRALYEKGEKDYYLSPLVTVDKNGSPIGRVGDQDAVIFCCRRGEREIELTDAFTAEDFPHFPRPALKDLNFVILTLYHEKFKDLDIAFAPSKIRGTLAEAVSSAGLRQLHLAESEKYAHVTFFLNGGNNQPFPGEEDRRVPSPKGVPFDQVPALSLPEVTEKTLQGIGEGFDLIAVNFANGDVIGHTANNNAKVQCAAIVDQSLGKVVESARNAGYVTLITADHGNLEIMTNPDGSPHVAHTTNEVPFLLVDPSGEGSAAPRDGILADIAPTVLAAMGVTPPAVMEGSTLLPDYPWKGIRKVLLIILDGWGFGALDATNPIFLGATPVWDGLLKKAPGSRLGASGEAVGLQKGKPGNSEAGHLNIGGGRVIPQDDVRLDKALKDGSFQTNEVFLKTIREVRDRGAALHLLGMLTEKSSHGSMDYPLALLEMAAKEGLEKVYLHMIFDGRSTINGTAPAMLEDLQKKVDAVGVGTVVSGFGRGLALDRDGDFVKIRKVYDALTAGTGLACTVESQG